MLHYHTVPVRPFQQNCTIVWCAKTLKAAIIDPGGEVPRLLEALKANGLTLEKIWITHGHLDHCGRIPLHTRRGFRGTEINTSAPRELARLVMLD